MNPLSVSAAGASAASHPQQCTADLVGGAQGTHHVGNVAVQAVDAGGHTAPVTAESTTSGGSADATAASARIVVGHTVIQLGAISSHAAIRCTYGASGARFSFSGTSSVSSLRINGRPVRLRADAMDIAVPGGHLHLNHADLGTTGLVQHAVLLDTGSAHVVIGESAVALASTVDNPCHP